MPNFNYVAVNDRGTVRTGKVSASSAAHAKEILGGQGWFVTRLRCQWWDLRDSECALRTAELVALSRELATLLRGQVTLPAALSLLSENMGGRSAVVLGRVKDAIQDGASPSQAFSSQAGAFEPTFLQMVALGERSGELASSLERYASYLRRQERLLSRIRQAAYYPSILLVVIVVAISILLLFSVPRFARMYDDLNAPLPLITEWLLGLSAHFPLALSLLGAIVAAAFATGRRKRFSSLRHLPFFHGLMLAYERARLTRSMATLLASGLNAVDVLETAGRLMPGDIAQRLHISVQDIRAGASLSAALQKTDLLSPTGMRIIEVAEQTGTLPEQTAAIAEFYEEDLDNAMARVLAIIEPVMILVMGILVGVIVLAMYMPIFSLAAAVG